MSKGVTPSWTENTVSARSLAADSPLASACIRNRSYRFGRSSPTIARASRAMLSRLAWTLLIQPALLEGDVGPDDLAVLQVDDHRDADRRVAGQVDLVLDRPGLEHLARLRASAAAIQPAKHSGRSQYGCRVNEFRHIDHVADALEAASPSTSMSMNSQAPSGASTMSPLW